jgi:hypothetical protein
MIRAAIFALIAAPAFASDIHHWGGSYAQLVPADNGPHVASVICHNELTMDSPMQFGFALTLGQLTVQVEIEHGNGDIPDLYRVTPPEGFIAIPPAIFVNEGQSEEIRLFVIAEGLTG